MTKRDFFRILIKLLGAILLFQTILTALPASVNYVLLGEPLMILLVIVAVSIVIGITALLIFSPTTIVNWLKLDQGFDDDRIEIKNVDTLHMLQIAIIIIGGLLVIWTIVPLFMDICSFLLSRMSRFEYFSQESTSDLRLFITDLIYISIGYLLLVNYRRVAVFLLKKDADKEKTEND